ncbi:putative transcription factor Hap2/NF-YA family [Helianthus annuus]|uniref:Nuclear transcription factor Y subunit n=2 Tax=Helianthus annuus TaxID=4232 RepID=A0A251UW15_HELAN|nr:putative transcription factor Hap2/NF-YA family [Helianthus annuus]KAJ0595130.1 putative transcription factor Hap2/NF-YA family [Helianthus annuus]
MIRTLYIPPFLYNKTKPNQTHSYSSIQHPTRRSSTCRNPPSPRHPLCPFLHSVSYTHHILTYTHPYIYISRERNFAKFQGRRHACVLSNKGGMLWTGVEAFVDQSTLSDNLSLKMGSSTPHQQSTKQIGFQFQFQDQDSSSTQSTSQSYPEVTSAGDSCKYWEKYPVQSAHGTHEDGSVGSALPNGTQDFAFASQPDHKQQYACIPLPYYHGMFAPYGYGSQAMLPHFQGMNITSTRVPLPPDFSQGEAIYVNAKQYSAILRRRQQRAKLEAQNKLLKPRKPYLHESRHVHALKRARGPGGRFLNLKKIQETQPDDSTNEQDDMELAPSFENNHGGSSDSTTTSNVDNYFHHQELKFSLYDSHSDGPTQTDGFGGTHHMFR